MAAVMKFNHRLMRITSVIISMQQSVRFNVSKIVNLYNKTKGSDNFLASIHTNILFTEFDLSSSEVHCSKCVPWSHSGVWR
jgi:hypothetical protein